MLRGARGSDWRFRADRPDRLAASADHRYQKTWMSPHAFAPNPSKPMESEMLPIDQVFRTAQLQCSNY
jgi:hypothetical protein